MKKFSDSHHLASTISHQKTKIWDFPGGTVDKNPPANVGNTGSIPSPGRFHIPLSS